MAYAGQLGRGSVLHVPELVQDLCDAAEDGHAACAHACTQGTFVVHETAGNHAGQGRVGHFLFLVRRFRPLRWLLDDAHHGLNRLQRPLQGEHLVHLDVRTLNADAVQGGAEVVVALLGEVRLLLHEAGELAHLLVQLAQQGAVDQEGHLLHALLSQGAEAVASQQGTDVRHPDFLFVCVGIDHALLFVLRPQRYEKERKYVSGDKKL